MIIDDLYVLGAVCGPSEADAMLVVDANTELPLSITSERLEPISRRGTEVLEGLGVVQEDELALGLGSERPERRGGLTAEEIAGLLATKGADHASRQWHAVRCTSSVPVAQKPSEAW